MTQRRHQARSLLQEPAPASPRHKAPIVAVSGGKGGVGKTVIAVNLALLAQQAGLRTLLVDLDPGLGNVDVHLRIANRFTLEDFVDGRCDFEDAVTPGPGGVGVLSSESASTRLASGDVAYLDATLDAIEDASRRFDLVICDTGAGIGPVVTKTIQRASLALAITAPEPAAATDAYALCKVLHGLGIELPHLVVNRARSRDEAIRTGGKLAAVCERFLGQKPEVAGWVRVHTAIEESTVAQRPCAIDSPVEVLDDFRALSAAVLSATPTRSRRAPRSQARRLLAARPID